MNFLINNVTDVIFFELSLMFFVNNLYLCNIVPPEQATAAVWLQSELLMQYR